MSLPVIAPSRHHRQHRQRPLALMNRARLRMGSRGYAVQLLWWNAHKIPISRARPSRG